MLLQLLVQNKQLVTASMYFQHAFYTMGTRIMETTNRISLDVKLSESLARCLNNTARTMTMAQKLLRVNSLSVRQSHNALLLRLFNGLFLQMCLNHRED